MLKRVALFVIGLMVAIGALLLYEYFSGASMSGTHNPGPSAVNAAPRDDQPYAYEGRRPDNADLEYVLTAKKVKAATNAAGTVIPGEFLLTEPAARYYLTDGRLVTIRSDSGVIFVDTIATGPAGTKTKFMPRGGRLTGHVMLTFGPQQPEDSTAAPGDTIKVKLSNDLEFDNVARLLRSDGDINVRSNQVAFDGSDLTIAFNPDQKRLEYFRIDKGQKIILHDVDPESLALADTTPGRNAAATAPASEPAQNALLVSPTTLPGAATAPAIAEASTRPGKASSIPTTYKLAFGQNVAATLGARTLTSDRLFVLFMAAAKDMDQKPKTSPADDSAGANAATPTANAGAVANATQPGDSAVAATEPLPKATTSDLVITWTGPMEMRPAGPDDVQLTGPKDKALEAVGTKERPVEIHDADRSVIAGRLWLHAAEKRIEIEAGDLGEVRLADATRGSGTCQRISYDRQTNHLRLLGPGLVDVPQTLLRKSPTATGKPLEITWAGALDLDLVDVPDPKKPGKKSTQPAVHRAILTGGAKIDDPTFQLSGDTLDVLIANTTDATNPQALEHLLATGNVTVKSIRAAAKNGEPASTVLPPDGINGQRLELLTAASDDPNAKAPVPSRLLVDGDVMAWSYRSEKEAKAGASGNVPATAPARDKPPGKETIYGQHLDIALTAKAKSADTNAAMAGALGMGDYQATDFTADGGAAGSGVKIELENYAPHLIIATAHDLHADPVSNRATLQGTPSALAKVTLANDTLTGEKILLDQNKQTFEIPGPGEFLFTLPPTKERKEAAPMRVTWTTRMLFDNSALVATFDGNTIAQMLSAKASDSSELTADRLIVRLKRVKTDAASSSDTELASLAGSSDLGLDTIEADGKVVASGSQTGPDGKMLTQMLLTKTEKLLYSDSDHQLTIPGPGQMLLIDNRPEKAAGGNGAAGGGNNARGETAFEWAGKLVYNQRDNTVELSKSVHMVHQPQKAIRAGGNPATSHVDLSTEHLLAKLSQPKDLENATALANPVGVGAGGNQQLENVRADGGATLTLDNKQELRADVLTYDNSTHIATATSANGNKVTYTDPDKQQLMQGTALKWDMHENAVSGTDLGGNIRLSPY